MWKDGRMDRVVAFRSFANALNDACLTTSVARISPKDAVSAKLNFFFSLDEVKPLSECSQFEEYVAKHVTVRIYMFVKKSCRYNSHRIVAQQWAELHTEVCLCCVPQIINMSHSLYQLWLQGSVNKGYVPNVDRDSSSSNSDWYKHSCISRNMNRASSESFTLFTYMLDVPGSNLGKFILYPDKVLIYVKENRVFWHPALPVRVSEFVTFVMLATEFLLYPGEDDPVPIVQEAGWAPGPVWTGAENLAPLPGFDPPIFLPYAIRCTDWAIPADKLLFYVLETVQKLNP